jgi:acyl-CoA synthetase (AMP-forming)/AMP-acid ligase II
MTVDRGEWANFCDVLRYRAETDADAEAFSFVSTGWPAGLSITYQELDARARAIAGVLQEHGAAGQRALLLYPPGLDYVAGLFSCFYAGTIAVPAYPPTPKRLNRTLPRLRTIVTDSGARFALTTSTIRDALEQLGQGSLLPNLEWLATDIESKRASARWSPPGSARDTVALLQYTSGSTADPRGVMITFNNLLVNSEIISGAFEHNHSSRGVIWLPPYHDMGLIGGILQPIYAGMRCMLMPPMLFLQQPVSWLAAISHYGGTVSGGPNFAYDLCVSRVTEEQRTGLDLSTWEVAFIGAELIHSQTLDAFAETFADCGFRREAFFPCYGLAEATLMITGGSKLEGPVMREINAERADFGQGGGDLEQASAQLVGCGVAREGHDIVIADPVTGTRRPSGHVGEIWIAGPSVSPGYWKRPSQTEETFRARLRDTGEGPFLRSGDLGVVDQDQLFVVGRLKELLVIQGRNFYPTDIEPIVEGVDPRVRRNCSAAFTVEAGRMKRLVVACEVDDVLTPAERPGLMRGIRQAIAHALDLQVYAVVLLPKRRLPKTSSGKIQRWVCREEYSSGALVSDAVDTWRMRPHVREREAAATLERDGPPATVPR